MLLAMDVGNTETVIGFFGPEPPTPPTRWASARHRRTGPGLPLAHLDDRRAHARRARHGAHPAARPRGTRPAHRRAGVFDVFIDLRSVPPAVDFQSELWHRMSDADVVVLIDTPGFRESRWTTAELAKANATNIQILHLLWPGQKEDALSSFSHFMTLERSDFLGMGAGSRKMGKEEHARSHLRRSRAAARPCNRSALSLPDRQLLRCRSGHGRIRGPARAVDIP